MTIYERIKNRRKELGLSADDVADALGVSRATVYRYESSYIEKLPTSSLEPLAKVLKCTPEYLMGWESSQDRAAKRLLAYYSKLNEFNKKKVDGYIESLSKSQEYEDSLSEENNKQ